MVFAPPPLGKEPEDTLRAFVVRRAVVGKRPDCGPHVELGCALLNH